MRCVVGIDLGSTTTKAVLLDTGGRVVGRGITNSRSSYDVACAVAREEALTDARFTLLARRLPGAAGRRLAEAFRLELYLDGLARLRREVLAVAAEHGELAPALGAAAREVMDGAEVEAPGLFAAPERRRSDFFRDLAGAAFVAGAEAVAARGEVPFERLLALFDRAILAVETRLERPAFAELLARAARRLGGGREPAAPAEEVAAEPIEELAFTGTGYGRQTLPFPKECVRSEILCHGRGAHRLFPDTRTVLDIGGQDTKAIQVDGGGVVTGFQMNDRCAAGSGRYLGYIADELNLGLHELGPLALRAHRAVRINSTCTVFAGAELRERLALGEKREEILAGLHRAMMLRAMSLLARSGGVHDQLTFTGGVCRNTMATQVLGDLVAESYGDGIRINMHPESIYMGALGAALFALDDVAAGRPGLLPGFVAAAAAAPAAAAGGGR